MEIYNRNRKISKLLLVIPAFRESQRLPVFLKELAEEVNKGLPEADILIVDDGSGNNEKRLLQEVISSMQQSFSFILNPIFLEKNRGKGGAVLSGWDHAVGYNYLGFVDADGAVPAKEVIRIGVKTRGLDVTKSIFGARIKMMGRKITRGWQRHFSGRIFSFIVGIMVEPEIYDSQCGLKFIPYSAYNQIRSRLKGRRFAFDVELVAALRAEKLPVLEVPIDWCDVPGSKVSMFKDTIRMLCSVYCIRKEMKKWI